MKIQSREHHIRHDAVLYRSATQLQSIGFGVYSWRKKTTNCCSNLEKGYPPNFIVAEFVIKMLIFRNALWTYSFNSRCSNELIWVKTGQFSEEWPHCKGTEFAGETKFGVQPVVISERGK